MLEKGDKLYKEFLKNSPRNLTRAREKQEKSRIVNQNDVCLWCLWRRKEESKKLYKKYWKIESKKFNHNKRQEKNRIVNVLVIFVYG